MGPVHANPHVVLGRKLPLVDEPRHELDGPEFMLIIESLKLDPRHSDFDGLACRPLSRHFGSVQDLRVD